MDNLITGDLANISHLWGEKDFTFVHQDVTNFIHVPGPLDYILHFASPASPIDYLELPIQTLKVGSLGTHKVLGLAREKKARILMASTSEVYGDPLEHPQKEEYWGNVNPVGPRGVYDEAKRFAEAMTMAYHRTHGVETRIVRIFNTYGPRMRLDDGRVLPSFMGQALRGEDLTIFGDGSQTRSFCFVDDLVEGILRLLRSDEPTPVNLGNPREMTIKEFGEAGDRRDRVDVEVHDAAVARRRPQGAQAGHLESQAHPRLGAEGPARGRPPAHGGLLQEEGRGLGLTMTQIAVTGGAGFVGSHVVRALLDRGDSVTVLDSYDAFYDPAIKRRRIDLLRAAGGDRLQCIEGDIRDADACAQALEGASGVIHLAALAGVRPSIENPARYMDVNVTGTQILLNAVTAHPGMPVVFGSSSSVYGGNTKVPFAESDQVDGPVSPYAASKKAGELICHAFHRLTDHPITCLRLFTVYGPGQRPEMAIHKFARLILAGESVPFFGDGQSARDYTYVSDIVDGILAALERAAGYRIYNLGGSVPTTLKRLVEMLERTLERDAVLDRQPDQPGDVPTTHADTSLAQRELGFESRVPLEEGLRRFAAWYREERAEGRVS